MNNNAAPLTAMRFVGADRQRQPVRRHDLRKCACDHRSVSCRFGRKRRDGGVLLRASENWSVICCAWFRGIWRTGRGSTGRSR